jgi:HAD superfamily hydrolase (TIGR01509 family)
MIRNLVWDFDGTLFDTYPAFVQSFVSAVRKFGCAADPEEVHLHCLQGLSHCARHLADRFGLDPEEVAQVFQTRYQSVGCETQAPMPGALDLCRLVIARSGRNVIVTHRGRASTEALLRAHGIEDLFLDMVTGDDGFPRKPDPAGVEAILRRNDLDRESTLAVGDRNVDIKAASAAGLRTCLFGAYQEPIEVTYHVSQLGELKAILAAEPGS